MQPQVSCGNTQYFVKDEKKVQEFEDKRKRAKTSEPNFEAGNYFSKFL